MLIGFLKESIGTKSVKDRVIHFDHSVTRITIGRNPTCNYIIGEQFDPDTQRAISGIQATIISEEDGTLILWDGTPQKRSANGVYQDPDRIPGQIELVDGLSLTLFKNYPGKVCLFVRSEDSTGSGGKETYTPQFILEALQEQVAQFREEVQSLKTAYEQITETTSDLAAQLQSREEIDTKQTEAIEAFKRQTKDSRRLLSRSIAGCAIVVLGFAIINASKDQQDSFYKYAGFLSTAGLLGAAGFVGQEKKS